jgi:ubiquinone/menaquinone biosynthesis C-methylase UbiE
MDNEAWRIWDADKRYGDTFYRRATGELPEMESSKKLANELKRVVRDGDNVLDVGCGGGHYLRSLRREIGDNFSYTGVDPTEYYIVRAREAFAHDTKVNFLVQDIFSLNVPNRSHEVVMCNNVLLHLPSIKVPLEQLVRVARRSVFIRFLVGDRSFRIQDVHPGDREFDDNGEPIAFHYYNIYSTAYVTMLLAAMPRVKDFSITFDRNFDKEKIMDSVQHNNNPVDATTILGEHQVNGYILQPWSIVELTLE